MCADRIINNMLNNRPKNHALAFLKIAVSSNSGELTDMYIEHIAKHNESILTDPYPNSGFDLLVPETATFNSPFTNQMVNMDVKTEMSFYDGNDLHPSAFYMFPRSSMSKTELILANHTGIIDCGYRGNLMGAFKWCGSTKNNSYTVNKHTRLLQITHPSLCPIYVILKFTEAEQSVK